MNLDFLRILRMSFRRRWTHCLSPRRCGKGMIYLLTCRFVVAGGSRPHRVDCKENTGSETPFAHPVPPPEPSGAYRCWMCLSAGAWNPRELPGFSANTGASDAPQLIPGSPPGHQAAHPVTQVDAGSQVEEEDGESEPGRGQAPRVQEEPTP